LQFKRGYDLVDLSLHVLWQIDRLIVTPPVLQDKVKDNVSPRDGTAIVVQDQFVLSFIDQNVAGDLSSQTGYAAFGNEIAGRHARPPPMLDIFAGPPVIDRQLECVIYLVPEGDLVRLIL
jgi:hypothetical protein